MARIRNKDIRVCFLAFAACLFSAASPTTQALDAEASRGPGYSISALPAYGKKMQIGRASFMADEIFGRMTANGELYDMRQLVAAHRTLPFHTIVQVRNLANNKTVDVRINDRGPYAKGRIIDLSFAAAEALDLVESGSGLVELRVLSAKSK